MSNYTKTTDFAEKDGFTSGNPDKIIKGAEFEVEFDAISTAIATKADTAGPTFTGTATFATTNATTVQIGGVAITSTAAELNTLDGITSTTAELNTLDGFTGTVDDLNYAKDLRASGVTAAEFDILDGLTATALELNILDGATLSTAELNLLDGVTATTAELNILDGVTSTATEINLLDGVTATTAELNLLDGVTATTAELNYVDGVTSAIQTQLDAKAPTASPTLTGTITAADLIITNRQVATDDASGVNIDGNDVTIRGGASTGTGAGGSVLFQTTPADVAGNLVNTFSTVMTLDENGIDVAGAVEFDSLSGTGSVSITDILDEDDMTSDSATALATQQSIKAYVDTTVAATNEVVEDTTPQLGGDLDTNGNNILFADNDKAVFGAGSDLQIYHDGSNSYVTDAGTGDLRIRGANVEIQTGSGNKYFQGAANVASLYHTNNLKLATTSTGIDVTGTAVTDGLTVDGATDGTAVALLRADNNSVTKKNTLRFEDTDTTTQNDQQIGRIEFYSNDTEHTGVDAVIEAVSATTALKELRFLTSDTANTPLSRLAIKKDGDVSFYEDTGTTAQMVWDASADALTFGDSVKATFGADSDLEIYHNGSNSYIDDAGTGSLVIRSNAVNIGKYTGETAAVFTADGSVQLRYDNSAKLETTNTGVDVTGNVVSDGLTVDGSATIQSTSSPAISVIDTTNNAEARLQAFNSTATVGTQSNHSFSIETNDTTRALFSTGGDISFYEDTGTTAKLFWDASAESLGIGTSSPSTALHVVDTTGDVLTLESDSLASSPNIIFKNTDGEKARINSVDAGELYFGTGASGTEALRIDSSQNVLIGNTDTDPATNNVNGVAITAGGEVIASLNGVAAQFNRRTTDGDVAVFKKGGDTKGSIGILSSRLYIGSGDTGIKFSSADDLISPIDASDGTGRDAAIDLGSSSTRFKDLYLSGGVYVGGTGSPNKLDDYEEGTFTFTLRDATSGGNASSSTQTAYYTKIGRMVRIELQGAVANIDTTGMTGANNLYFDLPFAKGSTEGLGPIALSSFTFPSGYSEFMAEALSGSVGIIRMAGDNVGARAMLVNEITSGTTDITRLSLTYFT